jgi:EAL domain-containing protein (putative c-di-GMP-specific phosphodiesterase class I)
MAAIVAIPRNLKLGHPEPKAARIGLDEALRKGWIEFWYQPKIDLRKKQLAGAELVARAHHPEAGVLPPAAFMGGAAEADLIALSEHAVTSMLRADQNFFQLGLRLRLAVNLPLSVLKKLPVADIVRAHRPQVENWPGVIIDIPEDEVITELALVTEMAKGLAAMKVALAVKDFGPGYSSLARAKKLPFAELKIGRTFVRDCGTDNVNAPMCKNVIDLAHRFGGAAVAVGIEKASDAVALTSMGCDFGQGSLLGQPMPEERLMSLLRQRATSQRRAM